MNCKGCMFEKANLMICASAKLKGAWNEFLNTLPYLKQLDVKYTCPYREDGHELKTQKELNIDGKHSNEI